MNERQAHALCFDVIFRLNYHSLMLLKKVVVKCIEEDTQPKVYMCVCSGVCLCVCVSVRVCACVHTHMQM